MANWELGESSWELGESSLTNNYEEMKTRDHQSSIEFFKQTTSPGVLFLEYPVCMPNLPFATPYPNEPLNTDLAITAQGNPHKDCPFDPTRSMEWRKERKRQQNREAARKSKKKKRELEDLQAKVKAISRETTMLRENITKHSEEIEDLRTENEALLEELRDMCDQETISRLESMDPENLSQDRQASYESDRNTNTSPNSDHNCQQTLCVTKPYI